ncbi:MAG TPA: glycosyltransferase [Candidatus Marinimicrobia bacterium]|nr:glycosyltransferase [Candidatus Neomarinimicrobiota bacterium]HJL77708.1 glycosyltransferase [Candidatus Neomarinimicrobiota bacterium]HJN68760.1 glycosyltransferase [Candidatus Neomarinimicrobiota bacterium]
MNVSVVIPTYNRAHLLQRALDSVFCQTLLPTEVIIVDDGSTDSTASLIETRYSEVAYIWQPNGGVSAARNSGIRKASGDWIAFLDSDDEWLPQKLEGQVEVLAEKPGMKLCHTEEIWIRNGRRVNPRKKHAKHGGWIFQKCLELCCISPSSVMIHRSVFDEVGLFDESLPACEDYDMWLRVTARYPVLYIDKPLITKYGGHEDQLSKKYWGMDRFRVQALAKIIESGVLSVENKTAAQAMIREKINIYIDGASKRGKVMEAGQFRERYSQLL